MPFLRVRLLTLALLLPTALLRSQVEFQEAGTDYISILINGQPFSEFNIGNAYPKPFLAPLRTASGIIVTRRFPQEQVEGESRDHPHHRGLFFGYGDVNGVNFWENEAASQASGDNPGEKGSIRLRKINALEPGKRSGSIHATFSWHDQRQGDMLDERRIMTFYADPSLRRIDLDVTFTAVQALRFADTKEGFFAIRVADSMAGKNGGVLTNSEGAQTEKDVWGKHADWVDYSGTVGGQQVGIAIFDHPENPNHPPRWHARDYGLFAVNPFGVKDFEPKAGKAGGYRLEAGQSLRFRYRVLIHGGDEPKKTLAEQYRKYAKGTK